MPALPVQVLPAVAAVTAWIILAVLLNRRDALPMDFPNSRSLHASPIPRVGGLGLLPGAAIALSLAGSRDDITSLLCALAAILFLLSILDDRKGVSIILRFGVHFAAAGAASIAMLGYGLQALMCTLLMAWMTNLYNFMDGANGLAGGMAAIGFGAYALAARDTSLVAFSAALSGAALGFLAFNFDPAKVFLGDAGSIPLGYLAGGVGMAGVVQQQWPWWFPLLVFSPFIVDASSTLVHRICRGEKFWQAHREHYYQRLIRLGWSHRRLALAGYVLMVCVAVCAVVLVHADNTAVVVAGVFWCLVYGFLMLYVDHRWRSYGEG